MSAAFPISRFRRLRANPTLRDMVRENAVTMNDLIYPIFVEEELDDYAPVDKARIAQNRQRVSVGSPATVKAKLMPLINATEAAEQCERLTVPMINFLLLGYLPIPLMRRLRDPALGAACGQLAGRQTDAESVAERGLDGTVAGADPWRTFYAGDVWRWPTLLRRVRAAW